MTAVSRSGCILLGCVLTLLAAPAASEGPQAGDEISARAFDVRYRSLADAADVVGDLLSSDGTMTLKPRLKILVVEDRISVLSRVEALLDSFDVAPRNVEVTFTLYFATRRDDESSETEPRRGIIDLPTSLDFFKFTYESLGSRSVTAVEGEQATANLSDDYRVVFLVESVDERTGIVKFARVSLQHVDRPIEGPARVDERYSLSAVVREGIQNMIGAASGPDAERALFLALKATLR